MPSLPDASYGPGCKGLMGTLVTSGVRILSLDKFLQYPLLLLLLLLLIMPIMFTVGWSSKFVQVVKTSVSTNNSPSQDHTNPDDQPITNTESLYSIYLLSAKCEVCTASYGLSFSFLLWPKHKAHRPWKQGRKKWGSITCCMDRANKISQPYNNTVPTISLNITWFILQQNNIVPICPGLWTVHVCSHSSVHNRRLQINETAVF